VIDAHFGPVLRGINAIASCMDRSYRFLERLRR
jgi:hypothetical protein